MKFDCNKITDIGPLEINKFENDWFTPIHLNTLTYILLQQEIDRGIFTRWFHLFSIFFSRDIHRRLRQFVEPIELLTDACVRACVGHIEPTSSRILEGKKKEPL